MIKYFRFTTDYILWELSWTNLNMLMATIPSYDDEVDEKGKEKEKVETVSGLDDLFSGDLN